MKGKGVGIFYKRSKGIRPMPCLTNSIFLGDKIESVDYVCVDGSAPSIIQFENNVLDYLSSIRIRQFVGGSWQTVVYDETGLAGTVDVDLLLKQILIGNGTSLCTSVIEVLIDNDSIVLIKILLNSGTLEDSAIIESYETSRMFARGIIKNFVLKNRNT